MTHKLEEGIKDICRQIVNESKSLEEWAEVESDDMFQKNNYEGGFDATENEFCFSVFINEQEYWFQLSLDDIKNVYEGLKNEIELREMD